MDIHVQRYEILFNHKAFRPSFFQIGIIYDNVCCLIVNQIESPNLIISVLEELSTSYEVVVISLLRK